MESQLDDLEVDNPEKPTLLKVLCILTFIGSSLLIVINIGSYTSADKTAQMMAHITRDMNQKDSAMNRDTAMQENHARHKTGIFFGKSVMRSVSKVMTPENIRKKAISEIVAALFTLFGAILMWQLKRIGFYLYIFGTCLSLAMPFFLYGHNIMSAGNAFFGGFFGLLFIALYALNIKSLR